MRANTSKINFNEEELRNILNECYKDTKNLKNEITLLFETWKMKVNEVGEIAVAGDKIIKLLDLRDKNIDKKLKIAQEIFKVIEKNKSVVPVEGEDEDKISNEKYEIPSDIKSQMYKMMGTKNKD